MKWGNWEELGGPHSLQHQCLGGASALMRSVRPGVLGLHEEQLKELPQKTGNKKKTWGVYMKMSYRHSGALYRAY